MPDGITGYQVDLHRVDSMQLDGEAVLLNLLTHGYFGLNLTGTEVWELVKAHPGISTPEIAASLSARYGQAPAEVASSVAALLDEMARHGLVSACAPTAAPALPAERSAAPYVAPGVQAFGDLDTLILSGE